VSKSPLAVKKCDLSEKSKTSNIPYDKKQAIYNALTLFNIMTLSLRPVFKVIIFINMKLLTFGKARKQFLFSLNRNFAKMNKGDKHKKLP
jgi:hypothetical protein